MIAIQQSERNGQVVAAALVHPDDEVMLISTGGVLIRTPVKSIREMSRSTQGVTLINLSDGEKLAGLERVVETDEPNGEGIAPITGESAPRYRVRRGACRRRHAARRRRALTQPWPRTSPPRMRTSPRHRAAIDALDREILERLLATRRGMRTPSAC